jgi:hypothetical protein
VRDFYGSRRERYNNGDARTTIFLRNRHAADRPPVDEERERLSLAKQSKELLLLRTAPVID